MWIPLVTWPIGTSFVGNLREHRRPESTRDDAVEPADAVDLGTRSNRKNGHGERLARVRGFDPAEAQERLERHVQAGAERREVLAHQVLREHVVPRRDRSVGREERVRPYALERLLERQPFSLHPLPDPLDRHEGRVAFVHVVDGRLDPHRLQRANAPHAEQDLLADSMAGVPAVQLIGQVAVLGVVLGQVGVEQEQRHTADLRAPDLRGDVAAGDLDGDPPRAPFDRLEVEGHPLEVVGGPDLLLPPVTAQVLPEVAATVEETHSHERKPKIARALQVIARQHAKATGIDRQRLVEPELGAEVGDIQTRAVAVSPLEPGAARQVVVQLREYAVHVGEEDLVGREVLESVLREGPEHVDRVVARALPVVGIHAAEQVGRVRRPGPPEISGEDSQGQKSIRQVWNYPKRANRRHALLPRQSGPSACPDQVSVGETGYCTIAQFVRLHPIDGPSRMIA